jgi:hypothetical protein
VQVQGVSGGQTGTQFNFPDLPYLRPNSANIVAIEYYTVNTLTNGTVSNTASASIAIAKTASLTIYGGIKNPVTGLPVKSGNEIIQRVPVLRLNNIQNASTDPFSRNIFLLNDLQVDWTKCFISLSAAPANTTNICFCFGVYFNYSDK